MNSVGKLIKDARLAKGLTQEELGNMVGVQKSAIAKYESGRVVNIKRSTLQSLARVLDLKGSDLIWAEKPAEELQGMGALAAEVLRDPATMEMVQDYLSLSAGDQAAVRAMVAALAAKTKKD